MRKLLKVKGVCTFITLICIISIIVSLLSIKSIKYNNYAGIYNNKGTNENGYIDVVLEPENVSVSLNDSFKAIYKITPQIINTKVDDMIFLIDLSKYMADNEEDKSRGRIICIEQILQKLKQNKNINETNCFFIGYNSEWNDKSLNNYNSRFNDYSKSDGGKFNDFLLHKNLLKDEEISNITGTVNNGFNFYEGSTNKCNYFIKFEKNLGDALSTANDYLSMKEFKDRNKAIVMFSRRACLYSTDIEANIDDNRSLEYENILNDIKKKDYQITTVNLSIDEKIPKYSETNDELLKLHKKLSLLTPQKDYNYILAEPVELNGEYQYGSYGDHLWNNIFTKIILGTSDSSATCSVKNMKLVFGKCDNFEVSNILINDKNYEFSQENGQLVIDIPEEYIEYGRDPNDGNKFIANPVEVSFSIKVVKGGNNIYFGTQNNGDVKAELSYSLEVAGKNDEIITVIDTTRITTNKLMDIKLNPNLVEPDPHEFETEAGNGFNVKYKVDVTSLDNLESTITKSKIDEVLFLIDFYKNDNLQGNYFGNGLKNKIINASNLNHMKMGIYGITKDGAVEVRGNDERNQYNNIKLDLSEVNLLDNRSILELRANKIDELYNKQSENSNVMKALKTADDVLQTEGEKNKNKAIVLMITGSFQVDKGELSQLINRGYKIIITDLSYTDNKTSQANESIKQLISYLGTNNFVDGQYDDGGSSFVNNSCDLVGGKINKLLDSAFDDRTYDLRNINFTFDLGEGFSLESNEAEISYEDSSGKTKTFKNTFQKNGKIRKVNIPDITFTSEILDGTTPQNEVKVKYTPYINNDEVKEGKIYLKFIPKFIQYTSDNPVVFGTNETVNTNNYFSYLYVNEDEERKNILTPAIRWRQKVDHGIYKQVEDGKAVYIEGDNKYLNGSIVSCASNINNMSLANNTITLRIDRNSSIVEQPKLYKYDSTEKKVSEISGYKISQRDEKTFDISDVNNSDVILLYSIKLSGDNDTKEYINKISVNRSDNIPVNIPVDNNGNLPDLF